MTQGARPRGRFLIVLDLEGTCDEVEGPHISGENRETIEVGAIKVCLETGDEVARFQSFVRPVVNPTLTDFCKKLIRVDQADVDSAPSFPAVARRLETWAGEGVSCWASWGNYDAYQWAHDCKRHQILPLPWPHINLKKVFAVSMGMRRRGLGGAYAEMGLEMPCERHRALKDAVMVKNLMEQVPEFNDRVMKIARSIQPGSECDRSAEV